LLDLHIRRGTDEYTQGFASLLPTGRAWPRDRASVLMRLARGLSDVWGSRVDPAIADFLERETDPRTTVLLLPEWERAYGLPDDCLAEPLTIQDRQKALAARVRMKGGQSVLFMIELAKSIGYEILVLEHAPFMAGVSRAGATETIGGGHRWEIGPPQMRFYWTVKLKLPRLAWFRAGVGQSGVDPHLRIGIATDLECLMRRFKPGHTQLTFDYTNLEPGGSMAGTP
jgi:uncharacterized protein YmfQ (DUF2313 family)